MKKTHKIIISILVLLFIAVLVEVGILIWPEVNNNFFPTNEAAIVIPVSNTEFVYPTVPHIKQLIPMSTPTDQPTLIRIKKPTGTPYASITPPPTLAKLPTKKPNPTSAKAQPP